MTSQIDKHDLPLTANTPSDVSTNKPGAIARGATPLGLTRDDARRRLEKFGFNAMPDTSVHPFQMALRNLGTGSVDA